MVQDAGTSEEWTAKDQKVVVRESDGFNLAIKLNGKLEARPEAVYQILTDPACISIFRGIKACKERKVLEEDKRKGTRKLDLVHVAFVRFLFISITFETRLLVWEDDRNKTIRFQLAKEGMMRKFEGMWHIQPFTPETVDAVRHPQAAAAAAAAAHAQPAFTPAAFLASVQKGVKGLRSAQGPPVTASLVSLEQNVTPRGPIPPGVRGLIRGLCAKQVKDVMEDLRSELERRRIAAEQAKAKEEEGRDRRGASGVWLPSAQQAGSKAPVGPAALSMALLSHSRPLDAWPLDAWAPIQLHIRL